MKNRLQKRLLSLAFGELTAAIAFSYLYLVLDLGTLSLISLLSLNFVLVQGSIYWFIKYSAISRNNRSGNSAKFVFRVFKSLNLLLIVAFPAALLFRMNEYRAPDLIAGSSFYLFFIIEYINYYVFRLSYGDRGLTLSIYSRMG